MSNATSFAMRLFAAALTAMLAMLVTNTMASAQIATTTTVLPDYGSNLVDASQPFPMTARTVVAGDPDEAGVTGGSTEILVNGAHYLTLDNTNEFGTLFFDLPAYMAVGTKTVQAIFTPDGSGTYEGSSSQSIGLSVKFVANATIQVTPAVASAPYGTDLTFQLQVRNNTTNALVTGPVTIYRNDVAIASNITVPGGVVQNFVDLPEGTYTFRVSFLGNANYHPSESNVLSIAITKVATTLTAVPDVVEQNLGTPVKVTTTLTGENLPAARTVGFYLEDSATPYQTATVEPGVPLEVELLLQQGTHHVTARYIGDDTFSAASATFELKINGVPTATTLSANPLVVEPGGSTVLTAVVVPTVQTNIPFNGSVAFYDGTIKLGEGVLSGNTVVFPISGMPPGIHPYKAVYLGTITHETSESEVVEVETNRTSSTTTLSPATQTIDHGQTADFTVTVASGVAGITPGGTVVLVDADDNQLATAALAGGTAALEVELPFGDYEIRAVYSGDGGHNGSISTPSTLTVSPVPGATKLTRVLSPLAPTVTDDVELTVAIAAFDGEPVGIVRITPIAGGASEQAVVNGLAVFQLGQLPAGVHEYAIDFVGEEGFLDSHGSIAFTVSKHATTTAIQVPDPIDAGAPVDVIVDVTSPTGTPEGLVRLYSGANEVDSALLSNGSAILTLSNAAAGTLTLRAAYDGDSIHLDSSSPTVVRTVTGEVQKLPTSIVIVKSSDPALLGSNNSITATVAAAGTPTGQIVFTIDGTPAPVALSGGKASISVSSFPVGEYAITASYAGDDFFEAATTVSTTQTIIASTGISAPSATIQVSPSSSIVGDAVTATVQVKAVAPAVGTPTGTVTFYVDDQPLPVQLVNGIATASVTGLAVGSHSFRADYQGDADFSPTSTISVGHTVGKAPSTTTIQVLPNPTTPGQTVTATATVTSSRGIPAGTVTFVRSGITIGTGTLDANGRASVTFSETDVTTVGYSASYSGSATHAGSASNVANLVVGNPTTTISMSAPSSPWLAGQARTVTATLSGTLQGSGTPIGTVEFSVNGGAPTSATLNGGIATFQFPVRPTGNYQITASYAGGGEFSSASASINRFVATNPTTIVVQASDTDVDQGDQILLEATVSSPYGVPPGTISFSDGTATIGTATLDASGHASLSWVPNTAGDITVSADYPGDGAYYSDSTDAVVIHVAQVTARTPVSVGISGNALIGAGETATVIATVSPIPPATGTPTGQVEFRVGNVLQQTVPLSNGSAAFTTQALAEGNHQVTATYLGDASFLGGSDTFDIVAQPAQTDIQTVTTLSLPLQGTPNLPATLIATVGSLEGTPAGGTVEFFVDDVSVGSAPLNSGASSVDWTPPAAASYSIKAVFSGFEAYLGSEDQKPFVVAGAPQDAATTTVLSSARTQAPAGETIDIRIDVLPVPPATSTPTGQVSLFLDDAPVGMLDLVDGSVVWTSPVLQAGVQHEVRASYPGATGFLASSSQPLIIEGLDDPDPIATSVTISLDPTPSLIGEEVAVVALVEAADDSVVNAGTIEIRVDGALIASGVPVNGELSTTWTGNALGQVDFSASFSGTPDLAASTGSLQHLVEAPDPIATATTVSASPDAFLLGGTTTLTATVSPALATGQVSFLANGATIGTGTLSNGAATTSWTPGISGDIEIVAVYAGDGTHAGSTSPGIQLDVSPLPKAQSTTVLSTSPNPSVEGNSVAMTATVSAVLPATETPTGSVRFVVDGVDQGTTALVGGIATTSIGSLAIGPHQVEAFYLGSASYDGSTSNTISQVVEAVVIQPVATQTILGVPASAVVGGTYSLSAAVTTASGSATGSVTFYDGATVLGTGTVSGGSASIQWSPIASGVHPIQAVYGGSPTHEASTSLTSNVMVDPAPLAQTSIVLSISPDQPIEGGTAVVTATVVAQSGATTPSGTVTFSFDGGAGTNATLSNGVATFTTPLLVAGTMTVDASYGGDATHLSSTASTLIREIDPVQVPLIPTQTTIDVPTGLVIGQTTTLQATVSSGNGTPVGNVRFYVGGQIVDTKPLVGGSASTSWTPAATGNHDFQAVYVGNATHEGSTSSTITRAVGKAQTTADLVLSPGPTHAGDTITATATIQPTNGSTVPTGSVVFSVGSTTSTVTLTNGSASFTTDALAEGPVTISVSYAGDSLHDGSSTSQSRQVLPPVVVLVPTETALSVPTTIYTGQTITLQATVSSDDGNATGTVDFLVDGASIGTSSLTNGIATLPWTAGATGPHSFVAHYLGDASHEESTSIALDRTVLARIASITTLDLSAGPTFVGDAIVATVIVDPTSGGTVPSGNVTLVVNGVASTTTLSNGQAVFTTPALPQGTTTISASYAGDFAHSPSSAAEQTRQVQPIVVLAPTTTVIAPPTSIYIGQTAILQVAVSSQSGQPTGTVSFFANGVSLGTAPVNAGTASLPFTPSATGSYAIEANYSGDASHQSSSDDGESLLVMPKIVTTTVVSLTAGPTYVGDTVTATATVTAAGGATTPTGDLTFTFDGTTTTATLVNGSATFTTPALALGTATFDASYGGDAIHAASTAEQRTRPVLPPVPVLVPTTTGLVAPSGIIVGQTVTLQATVASGNGTPTGSVEFWADNVLVGTATLVNGSASTDWTPTVTGDYDLVATYLGSATHATSSSAAATRTVFPKTATSVTVVLSAAPTYAGQTMTATATVNPASGISVPSGDIVFSFGGADTAVTLSNGSATFTTGALPVGDATVTATYAGDAIHAGSSGSITRTVAKSPATMTLAVNPASIVLGNSTSLTATISVVSGLPATGTIQFYNLSTLVGQATIQNNAATISWQPGATGSYQLNAVYLGSSTVSGTASASQMLEVAQPQVVLGDSSIVLSLQDPALEAGDTATVIVSVSAVAPATGTPTGQAILIFQGTSHAVALTNGQGSLDLPGLAEGSYTVNATYQGDAAFNASTADPLAFDVAPVAPPADVPTTSVLSSSVNPAAIGQIVAYDLVVTAQDGSTPQGFAVLQIGSTTLPPVALQNGTATWTTTYSQPGTTAVIASFLGDTGWEDSTSSPISQSVEALSQLPGSITIRQVAGGSDATFQFSSDALGLTGSITTSNGSGQRGPVDVQPGTYSVVAQSSAASGHLLTMIQCSDGDSSGDVATRTATIVVSAEEAVVCTFSSIDARASTVETIQQFLDARADIIVNNLPEIGRRIDRLEGTPDGSFNPGGFLMGYSSVLDGSPMTFSGSLAAIDAVTERPMNRFDVWAEGTIGALNRGTGAEGAFGVMAIGADYLLTDDMLVGVVFQYDSLGLDSPGGVKASGAGWLAGPYMTMKLSDGLYLDLLAAAGTSTNKVTPLGTYTDEFDATRILLNATLQGEWVNGPWTFSPRGRMTYFQETTSAYADSNGIDIPSVSTQNGTLALGPGVSYAFSLEAIEMEVGARVDAIADLIADGDLSIEDLRARVEGSVEVTLPGGAGVDLTVHYDGVGTSNTSYGAKAALMVQID